MIGITARHGEGVEAGSRSEPEGGRLFLAHDEHARGTVGDLARIAGGDPTAFGTEGGLQVGQRLDAGIGADALVGDDHLVGVSPVVVLHRHRDQLPLEPALGGGLGGTVVRTHRVLVECGPIDVPLLGDELGTLALAHESSPLGVAAHHPRSEGITEIADDRGSHRRAGHDLDATADDHVVGAGDDALGPEVEGLLGRAALAVDGGGRHRLGEPGGEHGVAAHVEGLLTDLHDAAHDHVVDHSRVEVAAFDQRLEGLGRQVGGVPVAQLPVALPTRCAHCVDDHGVGHCWSPLGLVARSGPSDAPLPRPVVGPLAVTPTLTSKT